MNRYTRCHLKTWLEKQRVSSVQWLITVNEAAVTRLIICRRFARIVCTDQTKFWIFPVFEQFPFDDEEVF